MGVTARFVRQENVKHYRQLLETVTDEAQRQKILRLLAEEQEKQRAAGDPIIEEHRTNGAAVPEYRW